MAFSFWIWFAGVECKLPYFLETLNSVDPVSLREKLFVDCDTNDFGSNGDLVDNAFSFAKKPRFARRSATYTQRFTGDTCQKFSYSVEISQSGVIGYTDVSKECKQA